MRPLKAHPALKLVSEYFIDSPLPSNISYHWNYGSLLGVNLGIMILTGVTLAMHYTPHVDLAFRSVEHIMRDVNSGWLIRLIHANGASIFFILTYLHVARGLYMGSYRSPRGALWAIGAVILILMMATAFLGYVLPWGQMSFWGDSFPIAPHGFPLLALTSPGLTLHRTGPHDRELLAFLTGSLLGDGHLERHGRGSRLSLQQESSNVAYLMWCHRFLADRGYCSPTPPRLLTRIGVGNKVRFYYRLNTYSLPSLNWWQELWYFEGRKQIVPALAPFVTPLTLAIWIQDDGCALPYGLRLSTNAFTEAEVDLLRTWLATKWGLVTSRHRDGRQPLLYLLSQSMPQVRQLVQPYMVPSMTYKLGLPRRGARR